MKNKFMVLTATSLLCLASQVYADQKQSVAIGATQSASQEWVLQQLANLPSSTITAADWAAICTTGNPEGAHGCFGNISSPAFARINKIIGGFADQVNIPATNVPNSIFIQKYYGGSSHVSGFNTPTIHNSSPSGASCSYFTTQGANLSYTGVRYHNSDIVGGAIEYFAPGSSGIVYSSDGGSSIKTTYYVLCIGSVASPVSGPAAGSLTGMTAS
jgi:hypothetical protein